jgi:anhydro-N-acetylmuramic acid kinase
MSSRAWEDALARVRDYRVREEHLVVGLMSGTSADAVDAALVRFRGCGLASTHEVLCFRSIRLENTLRREIHALAADRAPELERVMRLDAAIGERFGAATLELLAEAGVDPRAVDAVGSHGQTVRHLPRAANRGEALTLQLGCPSVLAERTGITVVSDFRTRDTAAGGEGAPLVPLFDWWCYHSDKESRVLLNIGGMANVTHIPRGAPVEDMLAFDTGPGNAILDSLAHQFLGEPVRQDEGGQMAARGTPNEALLMDLLSDPFFATPPPRSTGRERFGPRYAEEVRRKGEAAGLTREDIMATAVELTASSIALGVSLFLAPRGGVDVVGASGGGVRNPVLMRALEQRLAPARLVGVEAFGGDPSSKEAVAFAFLAHQTLSGEAGNVPAATGARRPVVLGHITPGSPGGRA